MAHKQAGNTVKKAAKKVVKKAAVKKVAVKKAAPAKSVVKKTAVKKAAAKTVAKKGAAKKAPVKPSPFKSADKPAVKKSAAKKTAAKKTATAKPRLGAAEKAASVSLKGLKVSGNKAARIAQIVAESFLNKPVKPEAAIITPAPGGAAAPSSDDAALTTAHKAAAVLFAKKAEEVVLMDLRNLSTVADYYLIATCSNEPQMRSILSTVQRSLSREGIKSLRSEYMPGVRWAVVDYGDMILHLFEKQTRGFYSLERLWADAPSTALKASDYALPTFDDGEETDDDGDL